MYWVAAMAFLFLVGVVVIEPRNLRRLVPAGLAGLILTGIHLGLPRALSFLVLTDTGPISDNAALTLLVQGIGGPMAAMWFAQGLEASTAASCRRLLLFAGVSWTFWWMAVEAGRAAWWGPAAHYLVCVAWYSIVWGVHAYSQERFPKNTYPL